MTTKYNLSQLICIIKPFKINFSSYRNQSIDSQFLYDGNVGQKTIKISANFASNITITKFLITKEKET